MKERYKNMRTVLVTLSLLAFCGTASLIAAPITHNQDTQQSAPDNTKKNRDQVDPTADRQKMNPADRHITQQIRKAVMDDKSLSTYAHNVKIITQDGKVTLRGPVRSEDEKNNLQEKAINVAGQENVTNQLEVAPSK